MNQKDQIEETLRRVLRQTTLRAILRPLGRTPLDVSKQEADELLAPFEAGIEAEFVMCREVCAQLAALMQRDQDAQQEETRLAESESLTLSTE